MPPGEERAAWKRGRQGRSRLERGKEQSVLSREIKLREPGKRAFCNPASNSSSGAELRATAERSKFRLIKSSDSISDSRPVVVPADPRLKELLDELKSRNEAARSGAARPGRGKRLLLDEEGPDAA